jgi:RNA polymerase sigma factor (sigma-70 family)
MSDIALDTLQLHACVERWQAGDRAAADELLRRVSGRLEHLARRMLNRFPNVRSSAETADIVQGSLLRLLQTLRRVQPESTAHFFNLAAVHIRRELLDLARRFAGKGWVELDPAMAQSPDRGAVAEELPRWCLFHESVEQLPAPEREVVGLVFYHGWTQAQIAALFQVDERTIRRRWVSACLTLNRLVGDTLPD